MTRVRSFKDATCGEEILSIPKKVLGQTETEHEIYTDLCLHNRQEKDNWTLVGSLHIQKVATNHNTVREHRLKQG